MQSDREKVMEEVKFLDFILKYEGKLRAISSLISEPFEESIDGLEKQISTLCSRMELVSWCYAYSEMFLVNAMHRGMPVKRKDLTERDRQLAIDFVTSKEALFSNWLSGLNKNIEKYLSNAQSVLSTKRAELTTISYGQKGA